ncbi:hypothetical protein AAGS40_17800 [Paraburkholderia sp. PREW-6R]|uniref:hypothetical protein n=1 Tax=Paraburkholderia sp. PREW-6R TaxID=3141544 RepID=UPI0031F5A6D2
MSRASGTDTDDIDSTDSHVIAGNIVRATPSRASENGALPAPLQTAPSVAVNGESLYQHIAPQSQQTAPAPQAAMATEPRRTAVEVDPNVAAYGSNITAADPKAAPAPRVPTTRDSLHRHSVNPVAAAMTDQLVKESAQLDPNLPPPDPSLRVVPTRRSSNPVADAMTDQLVRQSSRLDPALPPPNPSGAH